MTWCWPAWPAEASGDRDVVLIGPSGRQPGAKLAACAAHRAQLSAEALGEHPAR